MWNGKKRAITFSFDDGVKQDIRCVEILNKYGLKGTFNLNSGLLGAIGAWDTGERIVSWDKVLPSQVKTVYEGHEVAVHTLIHPLLPSLEDAEVIRQVAEDARALTEFCGYPVIGMAYPGGGVNNDDRVAALIRDNTPVAYARTITSTYSFELQKENLHRFNPTIHIHDDKVFDVIERFLALDTEEPQLLYIWGHSYEFDAEDGRWERFEEICKKLAGREDVFYGTNKEVLL